MKKILIMPYMAVFLVGCSNKECPHKVDNYSIQTRIIAGLMDQTAKQKNSSASSNLKTVSYSFGYMFTEKITPQLMNLNAKKLSEGLENGLSGKPSEWNDKDTAGVMLYFQDKVIKELEFGELSLANAMRIVALRYTNEILIDVPAVKPRYAKFSGEVKPLKAVNKDADLIDNPPIFKGIF